MKNIKALLFDFYGTLAYHKKKVDIIKFCQFIRNLGYDLYHQEWKAAADYVFFIDWPKGKIQTKEDFQKKIFERLNIKVSRKVIKKITDYYTKNSKLEFYPDAKFIKELPFKKAIITTTPKFNFSHLDLTDFDFIMTGKEAGKAKPHPDCFLKTLNVLAVKPKEAVMIGNDIDIDINPARKLGLKTILIDRENKFKKYKGLKIRSLRELPKLLK
jgi:HAD superfamily hydrolase (TIGR01509 family)